MKELYYKCEICGNVIEIMNGDATKIMCCGKNMTLMFANSTDASNEKHVPVYEINNNELHVTVGSIEHPMVDEHYIMWISLVTEEKEIRIELKPGDAPKAVFPYIPNSAIYAYCNLHGLWKTNVK